MRIPGLLQITLVSTAFKGLPSWGGVVSEARRG